MAKKGLNDALDAVEMTYAEIVDIANCMLNDLITPVSEIIEKLGDNINEASVDDIKMYMWQLQRKAYSLSEVKEKSILKANLAEALKDEKYASKFNEAEGSAAVKQNIALIESSEEIVVEALYELVANSLKTKVDQIHRSVDCLKSILVTRMQEAKLTLSNME